MRLIIPFFINRSIALAVAGYADFFYRKVFVCESFTFFNGFNFFSYIFSNVHTANIVHFFVLSSILLKLLDIFLMMPNYLIPHLPHSAIPLLLLWAFQSTLHLRHGRCCCRRVARFQRRRLPTSLQPIALSLVGGAMGSKHCKDTFFSPCANF